MNHDPSQRTRKRRFLSLMLLVFAAVLTSPSPAFSLDVTACSTLAVPGGIYTLVNNLTGAPVPAAPFEGSACLKIAASGITLDCNGFSITNSGSGGTTTGIVPSSGSLSNVAIKNCPAISGYTTGVICGGTGNTISNSAAFGNSVGYALNGFCSVSNSAAFNNSVGFSLPGFENVLTDNASHDNSGPGFVLFGSNNTLTGNDASDNVVGISVQSGSQGNSLDGNTVNNNFPLGGIILQQGADNNSLTNNNAVNNDQGAVLNSFNNTVSNNVFCDNVTLDIFQTSGETGNTGDDNQCSKTFNWNDAGTTGCTFICECPTTGPFQGCPCGVRVEVAVNGKAQEPLPGAVVSAFDWTEEDSCAAQNRPRDSEFTCPVANSCTTDASGSCTMGLVCERQFDVGVASPSQGKSLWKSLGILSSQQSQPRIIDFKF